MADEQSEAGTGTAAKSMSAAEMAARLAQQREAMLIWQERIVAELSLLTPQDPQASERFGTLVAETHRQTEGQEFMALVFKPQPDNGFFALNRLADGRIRISPDCVASWRRWAEEYPGLVERNPRLALRDLMQELSERAEGASWPQGFEWQIERWAASGAPAEAFPYPAFDDGQFGPAPALAERLRGLHRELGGWLFRDDDGSIVFAETHEFRLVEVRRAEARAEEAQEGRRRAEEMLRRWRERFGIDPMRLLKPGSGYHVISNPRRPGPESAD